ncbi:MAG: diguanylate cyclase, partial [Gemmatimonadaceae bacterium]
VVRSPVSALVACAVVASCWQVTGRGPIALAAASGCALVLVADPALPRPVGVAAVLGAAALMTSAALLPRALTRVYPDQSPPAEPAQAADPPRRAPSFTPRELRLRSGETREMRRMSGPQSVERDSRIDPDVLHRYLRDAKDAIGADEVVFWRHAVAEDALELFASSLEGGASALPRTDEMLTSLIRWAAKERVVIANDDKVPFLLVVGPVGRGDSFHGVLGIYAADRGSIARERVKPWLGRYASHLATLLELLEDARNARRYKARAQGFFRAAQRIQHNLDLDTLARAVCDTALEVTSATRAAFALWDEGALEGKVHAVSADHPIVAGFRVTRDSLLGEACREHQRFAIREAHRMAASRLVYGVGEPARRIGSLGIVPLLSSRKVIGAIIIEGDAIAQVTAVEVETLQFLTSPAAVALDNTARYAEVSESARIDSLTGLGNRRAFDERLSQLLAESDRYGHAASLILVDMDHFKGINDTHGHDAGDAVLRQAAGAISRTIREIDVCTRYGGEELAILLPRTGLDAAREAAERVRRAVAQLAISYAGVSIPVTASLGVACYPESTNNRDMLFAAADRALYGAKSSGRNCVRITKLSTAAAAV